MGRHLLRRRGLRVLAALLVLASPAILFAIPGDVNEDGVVDLGDLVPLVRHLRGDTTLTGVPFDNADVAPRPGGYSDPDQILDAGDLLVLRRMVEGDTTLVSPPTLVNVDCPTNPCTTNPATFDGTAGAGITVNLYVDGAFQESTVADGAGAFSFEAILDDGLQSVHATAVDLGLESAPSNSFDVEYENAIPRAIGDLDIIGETVVWTKGQAPGVFGEYVVGEVFIDQGGRLIVQPGVVIHVDSGKRIFARDATLEIRGAGEQVLIQRDPNAMGQNWTGVFANQGSTVVLENVRVAGAATAVDVHGATASLTDVEIDTFSTNGVLVRGGADASLDGVMVTGAGGGTGIRLDQAGVVTIDQSVVDGANIGIHVDESSPIVTASQFINNTTYGVEISVGSAPEFRDGSIIALNGTGFRLAGSNNAATDPSVLVVGSEIRDNATAAVVTASFATTANETVLDFQSNWWGGTDPEVIANSITDATDQPNLPIVDFTPFLDDTVANGGMPVPDGFLNGLLPDPLSPQLTYTVVGNVIVPAAQTRTLPAGATLQFLPGTRVTVLGTLDIDGDPFQPVVLESAAATPMPGDWDGIYYEAGSSGTIRDALIDFATNAIDVTGAAITVQDVRILDAAVKGIRLEGAASVVLDSTVEFVLPHSGVVYALHVDDDATASGSAPVIAGNTLRGADYGLQIDAPAAATEHPSVFGNTIEDNLHSGVYVTGPSAAQLTENTIRGNSLYGVFLAGSGTAATSPVPSITMGTLENNGGTTAERDLFTSNYGSGAASTVIDASENWWGTADVAEIPDQIRDASDVGNLPVVGFTPFRDSEGGMLVVGNYLFGSADPGFVGTTGTTYDVVGPLQVPAGETVTIQSGATLRFLEGTGIDVQGILVDEGGTFTSAKSTPSRGDWEGIQFGPAASGSSLTGTTIRWASSPVLVDGAAVDLTNVTIEEVQSDWSIRYMNAASGTISGGTIGNTVGGQGFGIELVDSSPTISGVEVKFVSTGLQLVRSDALVLGNHIHDTARGIRIEAGSSPTISGDNTIENNTSRGIVIVGDGVAANNPTPVINGNTISGHDTGAQRNLEATGFGSPAVDIDATLNYWGVETAAEISPTFSITAPANVLFQPFLNMAGDPVGSTNTLSGTLVGSTTISASPDPNWTIAGDVVVPVGTTLTVEAGVDVQVLPGASILVDGTLDVQGTTVSPAVFRSGEASPTSGSWEGIFLRGGSAATINELTLRHARRGIDIDGAGTVAVPVAITDSRFEDFGRILAFLPGTGIHVGGGGVATIQGNVFRHTLGSSTAGIHGIQLDGAAPETLVTGNDVQDVDQGIRVLRSDVTVTGNTLEQNRVGLYIGPESDATVNGANRITANDRGVVVESDFGTSADPNPVVTGNDVFGNTIYNVETNGFNAADPVLDFTGNWWGSISVPTIAASIFDQSDAPAEPLPYVDYSGFLDDLVATGQAVAGNYLVGVVGTSTSLSGGTTYEALGALEVPSGEVLTVPSGATIQMVAGSELRVRGGAVISGTLTSTTMTPGYWTGVVLDAGSTATIDGATIEYARIGVDSWAGDPTIQNSTIQSFSVAGVRLRGEDGLLDNNTISPDGSSIGIELIGASPEIFDNIIVGGGVGTSTATGIRMEGGSNPILTGNTITDLLIGIQLIGGGSAETNPMVGQHPGTSMPSRANANTIHSNGTGTVSQNLLVSGYFYPGTTDRLDFTGNQWNTVVVSEILDGISVSGEAPVVVDVSDFLDGTGAVVPTAVFTNLIRSVSRTADAIDLGQSETVTINFVVETPSTVTVEIRPDTGISYAAPIRTLVASPGQSSVVWDGRDDGNALVPDGGYTYTLSATDGVNTGSYEPEIFPLYGASLPILSLCQDGGAVSAYRNEHWTCPVVLEHAGNVELSVGLQAASFEDLVWTRPYPAGSHTITWDVRDINGAPLEGELRADARLVPLRKNGVIVWQGAPGVTGADAAPTAEVKSDPYIVTHSYEQFSTIVYRLDESAVVTVKLLPPGVFDPGDPSAIVLEDAVVRTANQDHSVVWDGIAGTAPEDENRIRTGDEGWFTFTIEATSQASGFTSLTRGNLNLRR